MQENRDQKKINILQGEQFHYEYIVQNRVIKLFQDAKKLIIGKDNTVAKELLNELILRFKKYDIEFKLLNQKEFDSLLREIAKEDLSNTKNKNQKIETNIDDLTKLASDAPVVNLVNEIILGAVEKKASDIHFESFEKYFRARYRINGYLQSIGTYPINLFDAVCARIKVLSKLDITQRRLAQDGKAILNLYDKKIDIRISTLPTVFGESIVLRLLGIEDYLLDLKSLGFLENDIEILKHIINKSYGAFILTGPTGSGKTTTLHALLHVIDSKTKNVITIEDPVEYTIEGINQVQINERIGYSFDTILRNILRQDPDIIMVGEMRDTQTADLALRSAMTGHLVMTTLHTNDAISSITRLINMDIERYIIESSVIACAAQRLLRLLCMDCKQSYIQEKIDTDLYNKYGMKIKKLYKPKGCSKCNNTGFVGRKGVFEIFEFDEKIREFIVKQESISIIRNYLIENNFETMFKKSLIGVKNGDFFLEEIKSVIGEIR